MALDPVSATTALGVFFVKMMERIEEKERKGWVGWDKTPKSLLLLRLKKNIEEQQWADVANFAAFLWFLEENKDGA